MKSIIEKFYQAFENLDAEGMIEYYHTEIKFEDPAFGVLRGEKAKNMWRMLCNNQKGKDFKVKSSDIEFINQKGKAHWEAYYTFSKTGRKVHNIVNAEFEFKDGKIINHMDLILGSKSLNNTFTREIVVSFRISNYFPIISHIRLQIFYRSAYLINPNGRWCCNFFFTTEKH